MFGELVRSSIACLALLLVTPSLRAEMKVLRIDPKQTDPAIATVHGRNIAVFDPQVTSRHRLLLFLVGTRSKASSSLVIDKAFASWGYHAISLDYENNVIAVACAHSTRTDCFDNYRQAIVTGSAQSSKIMVNEDVTAVVES